MKGADHVGVSSSRRLGLWDLIGVGERKTFPAVVQVRGGKGLTALIIGYNPEGQSRGGNLR